MKFLPAIMPAAALLVLALCVSAPSRAATSAAPVPVVSAQDVAAAEAYLNGLKNMKARFTQTDSTGQTLSGDFMLKRPGRVRFQYDAPVTDFIVADGLLVHYYDGQMKQVSSAPIDHSLAGFFLRRELKFSGDVTVTQTGREGGLIGVTLVQTEDPEAGSLTLFFAQDPMELRKWRIVDQQGIMTDVELSDVRTRIDLDSALFHYYDPEHKKPKYN